MENPTSTEYQKEIKSCKTVKVFWNGKHVADLRFDQILVQWAGQDSDLNFGDLASVAPPA